MTATTTASVHQPVRQFRIGSTNLADPDPSMSAKQVFDLYSASYPALRFAAIQTPRMEGEVMVIEATLPTVQTKGAKAPDPIDQLQDWIRTPAADTSAVPRWAPVATFIAQKLREPAQAHIDPFLLPLA